MFLISMAACMPGHAQPALAASAESNANRPPVFGPERAQVAGRYAGIAICGPRVEQFALELGFDESGTLQGGITYRPWVQPTLAASMMMQGPGLGTMVGGQAIRLRGAYDAALGSFTLQSAAGGPTLALTGFVTGGGRGVMANPPQSGMSLCTVHLGARGNELPSDWAAIAKEQGSAPGARGALLLPFAAASRTLDVAKDAVRRSCEGRMFGWLDQVSRQGLPVDAITQRPLVPNLFSDASFVPFFGKPFTELSESERAQLDIALQGSCSRDERLRTHASGLLTVLGAVFREPSVFTHVQKAASRPVYEGLRRHVADAVARLPALVEQGAAPSQVEEMLVKLRPWWPMLWPDEAQAVERAFRNAQTPLALASLRRALTEAQALPAPGLDALERLAGLLPARRTEFPYLTTQDWATLEGPLFAALSRDTPEAARRWAGSERTVEHARKLALGLAAYPQLARSLSPSARDASDQVLQAQRAQLLVALAEAEQNNFRAATQPGAAGMKRLEALMAEHRRLTLAYGELLQDEAFKPLQRERDAAHAGAVAGVATELLTAIDRAGTTAELERLRAASLRGGAATDGAAGQRVATALDTRLALLSAREQEAEQRARLEQERLRAEAVRAEDERVRAPYRERGLVYRPPGHWAGYHHGKEMRAIFEGDFPGAAQAPVFADIYRRFQEMYAAECARLLPANAVVYVEIRTTKYRGEPEYSYPTGFQLRVRREYNPGYQAMGEVMGNWAAGIAANALSLDPRRLNHMLRDIKAVTQLSLGTRNDMARFFRANACDSGQLQQFSENLLRMVQGQPSLQQSDERGHPYARNEK